MPNVEQIYISLGSNIDPAAHISSAINDLQVRLDNFQYSRIYRSPAVGMEGAAFLNAVVGGTIADSVEEITDWLLAIELAHGRVRTENKFSSRTLDLDLLLYGDTVLEATEYCEINLPHADITEQAYVLQPLTDIAADLIHPLHGCTVQSLFEQHKIHFPDTYSALKPIALKD